MKTNVSILFGALLFMCITNVYADDVIVFRNGDVIMGKVIEIETDVLKYKRSDNPDGPLYSVKKGELISVRYENGTQETFQQSAAPKDQLVFPKGQEFYDWHNDIDYLNVVSPVDLSQYERIILQPFDYSKVIYPDKKDNKYPALIEALEEFPVIIRYEISKRVKGLEVVIANESNSITDPKALYLNLSIDMLDMGSRAARFWAGFGAGAQRFRIEVSLQNTDGYIWNFRHERHSANSKTYKGCLTSEMSNFGEDIIKVLRGVQK